MKKARITAVNYLCDELDARAEQAQYRDIKAIFDKLLLLRCDVPSRYTGAVAAAFLAKERLQSKLPDTERSDGLASLKGGCASDRWPQSGK